MPEIVHYQALTRYFMQIMNGKTCSILITGIILLGLALFSSPVSATIFTINGTELDEEGLITYLKTPAPAFQEPVIIYFYDPHCGSCSATQDFWKTYLKEHPDTILEQVSLEEGAHMDRFKEFTETYNRDKAYIPLVYIGPVGLEGKDDIKHYFDMVYSWYMASYTKE